MFVFFCSTGRVAVIIFGICTLIVGVILSSVPWLNYFILKVSECPSKYEKKNTKKSKIFTSEFTIMERYTEFPLLATSRCSQTDKSLHIQCNKSRRISEWRKTETSGSGTVCLQVRIIHLPTVFFFLYLRKTLRSRS